MHMCRGQVQTAQRCRHPDRIIQCDSATYFQFAPQACVFYEVLLHITYSTGDRDVALVANHIKIAQDTPNDSYPLLVSEGFPRPRGCASLAAWGSAADPGLHCYDPSNTGLAKNHEDHKEAACYRTGVQRDVVCTMAQHPARSLQGATRCRGMDEEQTPGKGWAAHQATERPTASNPDPTVAATTPLTLARILPRSGWSASFVGRVRGARSLTRTALALGPRLCDLDAAGPALCRFGDPYG